ncbi:hypothetical protein ACQ4PT_009606 [Festuca glaucescens]
MERVVNNIFVPCKHGCNRKITYYNKDMHEAECLIGPSVFPISGCGLVAPTAALLDHLTTLHKLPKTPIELFGTSRFPVQPGCQLLCSGYGRLFLLDMVTLESSHAVSLTCVWPETPRVTVDVEVQFSSFEGHIHVSKCEIKPDTEPTQCLCAVPGRGTGVMVGIMICMVYYDNNELKEEDEESDDEWNEYDYNSEDDHDEDGDDD